MNGNRHYNNGANFERRIKSRLEDMGFTVFRTAGSHSPCDLIAIHNHYPTLGPSVLFVQAKGGQASMTKRARAEFAEFARQHGARPLLVERGMKFNWLDVEEDAA